ncbi:hypothetical protein NP233_g6169 [Leucocoprinus birnbaumii]|uniref:Nephrocystin 3-like N-terminal domain-containing protein n=1 Tax=Leucocoprinus birnbaumii TaxID=56174 RepID=A0AAD5YQ93_9AGAR|nr:hypothetical protein NP233_g6169 [Leucocoprinus birnbaumii]
MPAFQGAHDFVIEKAEFNSHIRNGHVSDGIVILYEASTPEAAFDAKERSYAPSCYPGTREQYIGDITNWATASNSDDAMPLFWMKGPAGVGKSAIAQTCAEKLQESNHLAAAFFFSINGRRNDHTRFFPTLAHQLSALLPHYREIVTSKVAIDRTLVDKTMPVQFKSLIVEPLQELKEKGREVQQRTIVIDGLDECTSRAAQVEIIEIIVSSIRAGSTPFRWAIFSREEAHIIDAFKAPPVSIYTQSVFLPISREADGEIEAYLRGGFINILRRRDFLDLASSWPSEEDIQKLVEAAAGLFAHPATVIRFIDNHPSSDFRQTLKSVLISIASPSSQLDSPYAELDSLYTLILQRVPEDLLPSMQLLFSNMALYGAREHTSWNIAITCNILGIPEFIFRRICQHLRAVIAFQLPPADALDGFNDQKTLFLLYNINSTLRNKLFKVHGTLSFHHKSFADFLVDPTRSSDFCVSTPAICNSLLDRVIQQQKHYASGYLIQGFSLVPLGDNSSSSLAWPQGWEPIDFFLKHETFLSLSYCLSHDYRPLYRSLEAVSSTLLPKLAQLDYRKSLVSRALQNGLPGLRTDADATAHFRAGVCKFFGSSEFSCLEGDDYEELDFASFYKIINKLEAAGVARAWYPWLGSGRASSFFHSFSRSESQNKNSGLYELGYGEKSVIWYWEFDSEKRPINLQCGRDDGDNKEGTDEEDSVDGETEIEDEYTNAGGSDGDEDEGMIGNDCLG